jgi:hypothetical protein
MSNRNNEDRTGAVPQTDPPAVPAAEEASQAPAAAANSLGQSGVGLNWIVPTEMVDIPSRGDFYKEGHPLHGKDAIEIRHMTAREEDILTSKSLLKKGVALDKVIQSVIVDRSINIDELLVGDKNAIMVYTRMYAYGAEYKTNIACPSCGSHCKHTFNLEDYKLQHPDDDKMDEDGTVLEKEWTKTEKNTFLVTLPKTQIKAELKLMTGKDERWLASLMQKKRRTNKAGSTDPSLVDQMKRFIVSLNNVKDEVQINEFIRYMPALDSRYLRSVYALLTPGMDLSQEFDCPFCSFETDMEVPFSAEFFWPK